MKEFAFDVKLFAVIRVRAETVEQAREQMTKVVNATSPSELPDDVQLTEFSLSEDGEDENREPFEVLDASGAVLQQEVDLASDDQAG